MADDKLDKTGQWWEAGSEASPWAGRLVDEGDAFVLRVTEPRSERPTIPEPRRYELIHGQTVNGSVFTLRDCFDRRASLGGSGMVERAILVNQVYDGLVIPQAEEAPFRSAGFSHPFLKAWLGVSGFTAEMVSDPAGFVIEYRKPAERVTTLGDGATVRVRWVAWPIYPSPSDSERRLVESVSVSIESPVPAAVDYFDRHFSALRALMALATRRVAQWPGLSLEAAFDPRTNASGQTTYRKGVLLRKSREEAPDKPVEPFFDMTFTANDLVPNLEAALARWFDATSDLRPVTNLYTAALSSQGLLEDRFLAATQGLETLHRRVHGGDFMPSDKYEANVLPLLLSAIPEGLSREHREALSSRMKYLNEYSLKRRLKELIRRHRRAMASIFNVTPNFAGSIADCRNLLTHLPPGTGHDSIDRLDLAFATEVSRTLLELCLLEVLGFSPDSIAALTSERQFYRRQAARWRRDA